MLKHCKIFVEPSWVVDKGCCPILEQQNEIVHLNCLCDVVKRHCSFAVCVPNATGGLESIGGRDANSNVAALVALREAPILVVDQRVNRLKVCAPVMVYVAIDMVDNVQVLDLDQPARQEGLGAIAVPNDHTIIPCEGDGGVEGVPRLPVLVVKENINSLTVIGCQWHGCYVVALAAADVELKLLLFQLGFVLLPLCLEVLNKPSGCDFGFCKC